MYLLFPENSMKGYSGQLKIAINVACTKIRWLAVKKKKKRKSTQKYSALTISLMVLNNTSLLSRQLFECLLNLLNNRFVKLKTPFVTELHPSSITISLRLPTRYDRDIAGLNNNKWLNSHWHHIHIYSSRNCSELLECLNQTQWFSSSVAKLASILCLEIKVAYYYLR